MKIVSVIVTFNRLKKLKSTIQQSLKENFEKIIIVNNNSTDGTKEYLDALTDDRFIIKHLSENIGGAGGFNVGFDTALKETLADWIVCYDDDAYPKEGAINQFENLKLDEDVASVAGAVFLPNGEVSVMNKVRINPFKNIRNFFNTFVKKKSIYIDEKIYRSSVVVEIDASTFVGYFVRTSVVRKEGLPRKELFIYADDLIYTLQLTRLGYRHLFVPSVKFIHACSTLLNNQDVYDPIWKVYYTYRNRIEMYRVSSRWLYFPITLLQLFPWYRKKQFYQNSQLYVKLLRLAVIDALKQDFSKSHSELLEFIERNQ
ncbi:glycosyltransferase [Sulfurovum sp.]|uniref:glycosyltransferase n=1 Tax=Sulfurovum sp. TaxID=1969726 RepID=UPI0025E92C36|nr:glycosyltransferase [Sulfurovum sp.]